MRDGHYLIGQGMAGAIYTHWRWPAKARVTLTRDGSALVEIGTHELGTRTYTVMGQVAADALGLAPEKVTVQLGDTRLPYSHPAIGSSTMANASAWSCWPQRPYARKRSRWPWPTRTPPWPVRPPPTCSPTAAGRVCPDRTWPAATPNCSRAMGFLRCRPTRTTTRSRRQTGRRPSSASPRSSPRSGSTPTSGGAAGPRRRRL